VAVDALTAEGPFYEGEPLGQQWNLPEFDKLLLWAVERKASDIMLVPGDPVWVRIHGAWMKVTHRPVGSEEIELMLDLMVRSNAASARIKGAEDVDEAHEVKADRFRTYRFRVDGSPAPSRTSCAS
jgi:Tfp pilus assembly pilus retraction ATPase PilT